MIPALVVVLALTLTTLYFEVFRHMGRDGRIRGHRHHRGDRDRDQLEVAGRVMSHPLRGGAGCEAEDLLVRLGLDELSAQQHSARANLDNAEKNLVEFTIFTPAAPSRRGTWITPRPPTAWRGPTRLRVRVHRERRIYSPIEGTVLEKNLEVGEMAFPGTAILTLADLQPLDQDLREDAQPQVVKLGQKAEVTVDGFPDKNFPGKWSPYPTRRSSRPRPSRPRTSA